MGLMRTIFTDNYLVPAWNDESQYQVFPTDSNFFESDYEAVMDSKEELRIWSHSTWPEDDFTPEQNREDLKLHEEDNHDHSAYGFMIYDKGLEHCYGSLYIYPISRLLDYYLVSSEDIGTLEKLDVRADFWLRSGDEAHHQKIAIEIKNWLQNIWKVKGVFTHREGMPGREQLYRNLSLKTDAIVRNKSDGTAFFLSYF